MENQIIELITKPDYIKNKTIKIYFNELYNNIKERIKKIRNIIIIYFMKYLIILYLFV